MIMTLENFMKGIKVKKFDMADAKGVQDLTKEVYKVNSNIYTLKPFTETELIESKKSNTYDPKCFFIGLLDGKVVSLANGKMEANSKKGIIHRAYAHPDFRDNCYSTQPMLKCVNYLRSKGSNEIQVNDWFDSSYREMLEHFKQQQIQVHHKSLTMRIDLRNFTGTAPELPKEYQIRMFRDRDDHTWATLKNAIFGGSATSKDFWKQKFRGVSMDSDFDPEGFFFAEKGNEPVGMCAGTVIHNKPKMAGAYVGGIGWTGVLPEHGRKGIGNALFTNSLQYLCSKGVSICEVATQFYRKSAVRMYEDTGFEIWYASFSLTFA